MQKLIRKWCQRESALNKGNMIYKLHKAIDETLVDLADHDIQRLLREVDYRDLALALKAMDGNAIRKIFDNLSERL